MPARTGRRTTHAPSGSTTHAHRKKKVAPPPHVVTPTQVSHAVQHAVTIPGGGSSHAVATAQHAYNQAASSGASASAAQRAVNKATRAANRQEHLLQKYVLHQTTKSLVDKHVAFDKKGNAVGLKETPSQIHSDLQKASENIRKATPRTILPKAQAQKIEQANVRGKVVGLKRIKGLVSGSETFTATGKVKPVTPKHARKVQLQRVTEPSAHNAPGYKPPQTLLGGAASKSTTEGRNLSRRYIGKAKGAGDLFGHYMSAVDFGLLLASAPFPEVRAGAEAIKAGEAILSKGGEAKSLGEAGVKTTTGIGRGAKAARAGGKALRAKLPKALQKGDKALATRAVERTAARVAPKTAARVGAAGAKAAEKAPALGRYGRALERKPLRVGAGTAIGAEVAHTPGKAKTFLEAHIAALKEKPGQTLKTSGEAAVGFAVAPLQIAANVGVSGARAVETIGHALGLPVKDYTRSEILMPTEDQVKGLVGFGASVAHLYSSGDLNYEKEQIEKHYGITLPLLAVPGAIRLIKAGGFDGYVEHLRTKGEFKRTRISEQVATERRAAAAESRPENQRIIRKAKRGQRRPTVEGEPQKLTRAGEQRAQRKEVSRAAATAQSRIRVEGGRVIRAEESARRKVTGRQGIRGSKDVHPEQAAFTLATRDISPNRERGMEQIRHLAERIKPQRTAEYHDAQMIHWIRNNPDKVWGNEGLWKLVSEHKRLSSEQPETLGYRRARYLPLATAHSRLLPEEITPPEARGVLGTRGTRGVEAKRLIRDQVKQRVKTSQGLKRKAVRLEAKAAEARKQKNVGRAESLRVEASALRDQARGHAEEANILRAVEGKAGVTDPTVKDFERDLKAFKGTEEGPAMLHQESVLKGKSPLRITQSEAYGRKGVPARIKRSQGIVAAKGLGKSSFLQSVSDMYEWRSREVMRNFLGHFVDRWSVRFPAEFTKRFAVPRDTGWGDLELPHMTVVTGEMADAAITEGLLNPRDNMLLDMSKVKGAVEESTDQNLADLKAEFDKNLTDIKQSGKLDPKRAYVVVPRTAGTELFKQLEGAGKATHFFDRANSLISRTILFSPAWQAAQIVAESLQASLSVNPYRLLKGTRAWNQMDDRLRLPLEAELGAIPGSGTLPSRETFLKTDLAERQASAKTALDRSGLGQIVKETLQLDILRRLDSWKGGQIRGALAMGKIDRDINGFQASMKALIGKHSEITTELKGKSWDEIAQWYVDHPKQMDQLGTYVRDAMGDWNTISSWEMPFANKVLFYPFLRMAAKWTFQSFPMNHSIKFAILGFMAQQHAEQIRRTRGEPPFFSDWATMLLDTGPGQKVPISLARVVPGANPLVQITGQGLGPQTAGVVQPILAIPAGALFGKNILTGEDIKGSPWEYLVSQFAQLPAPVRAINALTGPRPSTSIPIIGTKRDQSALSQLLTKLSPAPIQKAIQSFGIPFLPQDMEHLQDGTRLTRALDQMKANSPSELKKSAEGQLADLKTKARAGDITKSDYTTQRNALKKDFTHGIHTFSKAQDNLNALYKKYGINYQSDEKSFKAAAGITSQWESKAFGTQSSGSGSLFGPSIFGGGSAFSGKGSKSLFQSYTGGRAKPTLTSDFGVGKAIPFASQLASLSQGKGQPNMKAARVVAHEHGKGKSPKNAGGKLSPSVRKLVKQIPSIGNSRNVAGTVTKLARSHNLPPSVLMGQLEQETRFSAGSTSSAGAGGEAQFMPANQQHYGVKLGTSAHAIKSQLRGQAEMMADLVHQHGNVTDALNAYYGSSAPYTDASGTGSYAQKVLGKAKSYRALDKTQGSVKGPYVHPFPQAHKGRIDMGVDYTGSGPIKAIGKARIEKVGAAGWPNGGAGPSGQGVLYKLLDGPNKGKHVYVYEGVTPRVKPGQTVKKGDPIATFYPGSSIEIGFANKTGAPLAHTVYSEGDVTKAGTHFSKFVSKLPGGGGVGKLPPVTGTASTAVSAAPVASGSTSTPLAATPSVLQTATSSIQSSTQLTPLQKISMVQTLASPNGAFKLLNIPGAFTSSGNLTPIGPTLLASQLTTIAATRKKLLA